MQEVARMSSLLALVGADLGSLKLAIAGTVTMSERLQAVVDSLNAAQTPAAWTKLSWDSRSIGAWAEALKMRGEQLQRWIHKIKLPIYWLSGLFNPRAFLTAVCQQQARANSWPFDQAC